MKIDADPSVIRDIWEHFQFAVPGARHMPSYRNGTWDGNIRLFNARNGQMYAGLYGKLLEFAACPGNDYIVEPVNDPYFGMIGADDEISPEEFDEFIQSLNLRNDKGEPISPRDYQITALQCAFREKTKLVLSPTASGKSLVIYALVRWMQLLSSRPIVVVVPTTQLVRQMYGDFEDYSSADEWSAAANCHMVYSGKDKITKHQVTITTWQSLAKFPAAYMRTVDGLIGDEAHTFQAKTLTGIMESIINAKWRIGLTGTLDGSKVSAMVLEGLFGPIQRVASTKELQDAGQIAQLKIDILLLKWPEATRKAMSKADYQSEISFLTTNETRNMMIRNLALDQDGNTIVMFRMIEHGKAIYDLICEKAHKRRKVFFVDGQTDVEVRDQIRKIVENEKDAIIVASVVFATGTSINNLHNIIFAQPMKGQIKVLQSIGRGLRISEDGRPTKLIDLADDIQWKKWRNYTLRHAGDRIKIYAQEKFDYRIFEIPFEG